MCIVRHALYKHVQGDLFYTEHVLVLVLYVEVFSYNCFVWLPLMQIENGATLSPLDAEQMTPVGRAMERGAKKSAQYLLQIGKPT